MFTCASWSSDFENLESSELPATVSQCFQLLAAARKIWMIMNLIFSTSKWVNTSAPSLLKWDSAYDSTCLSSRKAPHSMPWLKFEKGNLQKRFYAREFWTDSTSLSDPWFSKYWTSHNCARGWPKPTDWGETAPSIHCSAKPGYAWQVIRAFSLSLQVYFPNSENSKRQ